MVSNKSLGAMIDYRTIAYSPSYYCKSQCRHCYLSLETRSRDQYKEVVFRSLLDGLPKSVRLIDFTGGEPFQRPRRFLRHVKDVGRTGRFSSVVTNGLWFRQHNRPERLLAMLREHGLRGVAISTDSYHRPRLRKRELWCLVDLCRKLKLLVMLKDIGIDALARESELRKEEILDDKTIIKMTNLEHVGNAANLVPDMAGRREFAACRYALIPHVDPNGNVYACCSLREEVCRGTVLDGGNVLESSIEEILAKMSRDPILLTLVAVGPGGLGKLAGRDKEKMFKKTSKCEMCVELVKNESVTSMARSRVESDIRLKKELVAKYMLLDTRARESEKW